MKLSVEFFLLGKRLSFFFLFILIPYLNYNYTGKLHRQLLLPSHPCVFAHIAVYLESYRTVMWLPGLCHLAQWHLLRDRHFLLPLPKSWRPILDRPCWNRIPPSLALCSDSLSSLCSLKIFLKYSFVICLHLISCNHYDSPDSVCLLGTTQCWSSLTTCWKVPSKIFCSL